MFDVLSGYKRKKKKLMRLIEKAEDLFWDISRSDYYDLDYYGEIGNVVLDKNRYDLKHNKKLRECQEQAEGLKWAIARQRQAVVDAETLKEEVQQLAEDKDALLQSQCAAIEEARSIISYMDKR